ncbi:Hypothetical predicted protein [Pelobates cultripes]|uniref:Uncharacterized protein n=1 Tax=Pelobates cultripes TaxID=61616 RepID=A0AAD1SRF0_PELCU|nr:Hypothetical predicted protein [Pelobates cultripes]
MDKNKKGEGKKKTERWSRKRTWKKKLLEKDAHQYQKVCSLFKIVATKHDLPPTSQHEDSGARCSTAMHSSVQSTVQLATDTGEDIRYVELETDKHDESLAEEEILEVVGIKEGMPDMVDDKTWFIRSTSENLDSFLLFYPCQPVVLSFNSKKLYQKRDGKKRHWWTYSHGHGPFSCMVCVAFSKKTDSSVVIDGCIDEKCMYQTIEELERSNFHNNGSESFLMRSKNMDISRHFFEKQTKPEKEEK